MSIKMGSVRMGGAVVDNKMSVGGGIKIGGGGSAPVVEATWGQIEGDIENQLDLTAALNGKLTTPSGTNGQFLSLVNGVWTAVDLPTYEGGVN